MFCKIGFLKNVINFTGKHMYWSLFLIKLQAYPQVFIKKGFQHRCFSVNIAKFLRAAFFNRTPLVAASAFLYPFGFLTFSGDIDMEHWHEIGLTLTLFFPMFPFNPSERIRKPKVSRCFHGDQRKH